MPPTLHIYVPLHVYQSLHVDPKLLLISEKKQQNATSIYHAIAIYLQKKYAPQMRHAQITLHASMGKVC